MKNLTVRQVVVFLMLVAAGGALATPARKVLNVVNFVRALDPRMPKAEYVQPGVDPESHRGLFRWRDENSDCQPTWADYRRLTGHDAHSTLLNDKGPDGSGGR